MNKKVDDSLVNFVMQKLENKEMKVPTASVILGISIRQIYKILRLRKEPFKRKVKTIRKPPSNKIKKNTEEKVVELYRSKYRKFSYIHFHEKLESEENIIINLKTLERTLMRHYLVSPFANKKTKKNVKKILQSLNQINDPVNEQNPYLNNNIIFEPSSIHNRIHHTKDFGALIQLDARKDFYIDEEKRTLHLAIDVASGIFVGAFFDKEETLTGYQHVLHQIITKYGIPKCILTDNRTVFEYLKKDTGQESKNTLIQFKYSCIQLGIKLNTTSVATFKAIIEKGNGTFGRRIPQELSIANIKNIKLANVFLTNYLPQINNLFAHEYPGKNIFKATPDIETINNCIGFISKRKFDKASCVRFQNKYYYATICNKIVAFIERTECLIVHTFNDRVIIVVDSIAYVAICIDDYEFSSEKQCNPNSETFIETHRVNPTELINYRNKNVSIWNYDSFQKYLNEETRFINENY